MTILPRPGLLVHKKLKLQGNVNIIEAYLQYTLGILTWLVGN